MRFRVSARGSTQSTKGFIPCLFSGQSYAGRRAHQQRSVEGNYYIVRAQANHLARAFEWHASSHAHRRQYRCSCTLLRLPNKSPSRGKLHSGCYKPLHPMHMAAIAGAEAESLACLINRARQGIWYHTSGRSLMTIVGDTKRDIQGKHVPGQKEQGETG